MERTKKSKRNNVLAKFIAVMCISMAAIISLLLCSKDTISAEEQAVELSLNKKNEIDNAAFHVSNMFPGDVVEGNYCVKVSYKGTVTVGFRVDIGKGYDKLAEVLKCKIVLSDTDELLYDGLMKDVPEALEHVLLDGEKGETELCYQISAYLDTSVGNTYQNTSLEADFVWWIEAEEQENTGTGEDVYESDMDVEGDNASIAVGDKAADDDITPFTGDDTDMAMWLGLVICAAAVFIVHIVSKKRKEGKDNGQ